MTRREFLEYCGASALFVIPEWLKDSTSPIHHTDDKFEVACVSRALTYHEPNVVYTFEKPSSVYNMIFGCDTCTDASILWTLRKPMNAYEGFELFRIPLNARATYSWIAASQTHEFHVKEGTQLLAFTSGNEPALVPLRDDKMPRPLVVHVSLYWTPPNQEANVT